jgi:hypothetical protein
MRASDAATDHAPAKTHRQTDTLATDTLADGHWQVNAPTDTAADKHMAIKKPA